MKIRVIFQDVTDVAKAAGYDFHAPLKAFVEVNDYDTGKSVNVGEWASDGEYECLDLELAAPPVKLTGYRGSADFTAYKNATTLPNADTAFHLQTAKGWMIAAGTLSRQRRGSQSIWATSS